MKKALLFALTLTGTCLLLPSISHATPDLRIDFGIHGGLARVSGSFRRGGFGLRRSRYDHGAARVSCRPTRARHVHRHHWVPRYERVWTPPVYRTIFAGYDVCGNPVYRRVCVRVGHYRQVRRGSRCGCGHHRH